MITQRKLWKLSQVIDAIRCPNTSCNARYHKCCAKRECSKCKKEFIRIPAANHSDDNEEDEVWNWVNYWFKLPKWFFSAYHMSHMILVLKILQYTASIQKIEIDAGFFLAKSFWLKVVDDFIENRVHFIVYFANVEQLKCCCFCRLIDDTRIFRLKSSMIKILEICGRR